MLEQLWASRYYVASNILAAGVNLLHVDTDSAFLSDPYALLKQPPLSMFSLLILPETPANGGMWYAQNTSAGSGAARTWLQARGPMLPGKIGAADAEEEARRGAFASWAARPGSEHQFIECISLSRSEFSVQRVVETNFSLLLREWEGKTRPGLARNFDVCWPTVGRRTRLGTAILDLLTPRK